MTSDVPDRLHRLAAGDTLPAPDAEALFLALLQGQLDPAQIAAVLSILQLRGPTRDELVGAARAMRASVTPVPYTPRGDESLLDTCGTGGAPKTFNVSTAAALVAAGITPPQRSGLSRLVVAKHGNRSRTGRGSAEVLASLGVHIDATPETQARCLREVGVCFCFAIHHHPAMKHAMPVRRSLGFPTIFNLLGPLTNPAGARRQLIGASIPNVELLAQALADLGAVRAIVAHGSGGLDELSTTGPNTLAHVEHTNVRVETHDPATIGIPRARFEDLAARDVDASADLVRAILDGGGGPARDMVVLNAAAAAVVAGACETLAEGAELAKESINTGRASKVLSDLAAASSRPS